LAIGVPTNRITSIINGERGITGETAMLLGHAFNTTPEFWVNMQARYELDVAKSKVRKESIRLADEFARGLVRASP
jgi:addiction module HigA family antidote